MRMPVVWYTWYTQVFTYGRVFAAVQGLVQTLEV